MAKRPAMPKADAGTQAFFESILPTGAGITVRPMFGHRAAFVNGNMFSGSFGVDVFVRLDDASRSELLAVTGAHLFEPMAGRPMAEYVVMPRTWSREPERATEWVSRSFAWARTLPAKQSRPKSRASRQPKTTRGRR